MTFPAASFTDSSRNTFRSCSTEICFVPSVTCFFRPTVKTQRVFTSEPGIWRLLLHILQETLLRLQPNLFGPRTELYIDVLFFSPDLHSLHPSSVTRYHLAIGDLLDHQPINRHQPQCPLEQVVTANQDGFPLDQADISRRHD